MSDLEVCGSVFVEHRSRSARAVQCRNIDIIITHHQHLTYRCSVNSNQSFLRESHDFNGLYFLATHNVEASYNSSLRCPFVRLSVCPSVCYMPISPKVSGIDRWLLENSNRYPGSLIQSLPSDSRSEVRFCYFGYFRVGTSPTVTEIGYGFSEYHIISYHMI